MEKTGRPLSLRPDSSFRGAFTHNGKLLKLHQNHLTSGYSRLVANADPSIRTNFGDAVWYAVSEKNNVVYQDRTVAIAEGTTAELAGIVIRRAEITTAYPTLNEEITPVNRGDILKEGYVEFKSFTAGGAVPDGTGTDILGFADVSYGDKMFINILTSKPYFAAAATGSSGDIEVGKIVLLNPDDKAWTVKFSV